MLDKRLQTIFDLLNKGMIVADVGCDHAFLAIELIKHNKAKKVYACDVAIGPLKKAQENIELYGLYKKIEVILSDGLKNVPGDCEAVVIAGMGYYTVKKILEESLHKLEKYKQIIIQINTDVDLFRQWISDNNFTIVNEKMVKVKHYYTIIELSLDKRKSYNNAEILFGPKLIESKEEIFLEYLSKKKKKLNKLIQVINNQSKIDEYNNVINIIDQILNIK